MASDVELSGVRIPPGTSSSSVLDWDPAEFTETDEFGLDRGLRNDVALGMGVHYCLGASPSGAMKPPVSRKDQRQLNLPVVCLTSNRY